LIELDDTTIRNLYATREEIRAAGGECFPLQSHLGRMEEINKMVEAVVGKYGRIDILVNNAGASPAMKAVLETDERLWETVMNLNLRVTYFTSQAVAKIMKTQGGGRIINIASVDSYREEPGVSVYSISKAGVLMVTKAFAKDLAPYNILVNAIAPGPIRSKMMDFHWVNLPPEEAQKHIREAEKRTRLGRLPGL
jgi:NAD(P)-dependent dehydrogenase (short-subunit alcohol dehydrogenase family)